MGSPKVEAEKERFGSAQSMKHPDFVGALPIPSKRKNRDHLDA